MWLIENTTEGKYFWPINTDQVLYISIGNDDGENGRYYIKFHFNGEQKGLRWLFAKAEERNIYLEKIREKLPRLDLGLNDITLE